jgi:predicted secreted hydrolase
MLMNKAYKPIKFPEDESKHDTIGEWWYFNGNLTDKDGRQYSYMNTLFRVVIPPHSARVLSRIPKKNFYVYHSIITDIDQNKFFPHMDYLVGITHDSFKHSGLNVYFSPVASAGIRNLKHYHLSQSRENKYAVKGEDINLQLISKKPPLLENQTGYVDFFDRPTFYYSLTDLETEGTIVVDGKIIEVTGKSWMDHQWSNVFDITRDSWNWFSVQLENHIEIVCYEHVHRGQSAYLATIIYPDGRQKSFNKALIKSLGRKWKSPKTKAAYGLAWEIEIPEADIKLAIESRVENHEMNFLNVNYWESPTKIEASINGNKVKGYGYMELAGRPSIFNNLTFLKSKILERVPMLSRKNIWKD